MKLLLLTLLTTISAAAAIGLRDHNGNLLPESPSQKTIAGFGGLLIVTPDEDWEAKWNTPSDVAPYFSRRETVERGQKLFILTIFTNPKLNDSGLADVTANINVRRPDGSPSTQAKDADCYRGKFMTPLKNVYLCRSVIGFVGEPSDLAGVWSVGVDLTDNVQKVTIPLSATFTLK